MNEYDMEEVHLFLWIITFYLLYPSSILSELLQWVIFVISLFIKADGPVTKVL